jgi:DNA polymerase III epsilon subunit-like protein
MLKLAFDTETSGIDPDKYCLLTAYFAVLDENDLVVDELDLKVMPDNGEIAFEQSALNVNGIDLEAHKEDAITYSEGAKILESFLSKHSKGKKPQLQPCGHNISFDINFIKKTLLPVDRWEKYCHYRVLDTTPITSMLKEVGIFGEKVGSLESLVEHFGVEKRSAHNAKEDVLMWIDVFKSMKNMLKQMKNGALVDSNKIDILLTE